MLCKRLVTVLTFHDGVLFRTKLFEADYRYTANFVDAWSIDEIVILDITRPPAVQLGDRFLGVIREFAARCFVPAAAGGGIRTLGQVELCLKAGADKVVINTGALDRPELITEISKAYGSQCVVLSIDAKRDPAGGYRVFSNAGREAQPWTPEEWARRGEELGAGEILITSIDRDGSLQGYDLELCTRVSESVRVPVLILGGAGNWSHLVDGIEKAGADAVCTQNIYHFTETSIRSAKAHMHKAGIRVRI